MDGSSAISLTQLIEETILSPPLQPYPIISSPSPTPNRALSPTPSQSPSPYNSTLTMVDIEAWYNNWMDSDDSDG